VIPRSSKLMGGRERIQLQRQKTTGVAFYQKLSGQSCTPSLTWSNSTGQQAKSAAHLLCDNNSDEAFAASWAQPLDQAQHRKHQWQTGSLSPLCWANEHIYPRKLPSALIPILLRSSTSQVYRLHASPATMADRGYLTLAARLASTFSGRRLNDPASAQASSSLKTFSHSARADRSSANGRPIRSSIISQIISRDASSKRNTSPPLIRNEQDYHTNVPKPSVGIEMQREDDITMQSLPKVVSQGTLLDLT
jgi:hypothetical protein